MTLYLSRAGAAERSNRDLGALVPQPPTGEQPPLGYTYDPARAPINRDIHFFRSTRLWFEPHDGDNLVYQTASLTEALEVGGPVELELYFSTTVEDTDFYALLVDIDERGRARALTIGPGRMRARYLSGWETPSALEPGRIYRANIELWDIAHRFERGHRIGLAIRSEWFPGFARNLNTMEPIASATRIAVARQSIYGDERRPSVLRFRVLPQQ
jgi:putative CocE/NonD family hydrolase